ncbi:(2Fe-2S)-binding protein [Nocardioides sp. LHG3406-4]|uniref:(2Fe-2S)-binding protein n=1 Tax=Nocardioides sp. LHG3406-4 TaxID=2804575 RepID=UPI003CF3F9F0
MSNTKIEHGDVSVTVEVNGKVEQGAVPPLKPLADFLRDDLGLTGTKLGCRAGDCGSCTVLLDDVPVASCLMPMSQVGERKVTTIEGLAGEGALSPLQQAFRANNASQCGFCIPGILMASVPFLNRPDDTDRDEIVRGLAGNLCRCTGYESIVDAIAEAAHATKESR